MATSINLYNSLDNIMSGIYFACGTHFRCIDANHIARVTCPPPSVADGVRELLQRTEETHIRSYNDYPRWRLVIYIYFYRYKKLESNCGYICLELELGSFTSVDIEKKGNTRVHVGRRLIWETCFRPFLSVPRHPLG